MVSGSQFVFALVLTYACRWYVSIFYADNAVLETAAEMNTLQIPAVALAASRAFLYLSVHCPSNTQATADQSWSNPSVQPNKLNLPFTCVLHFSLSHPH
jgi:hypothetical protein